jgi:serine/threonine-protein kinase
LTPGGIKLESEIEPHESIAQLTGRRLDFWIFGILAVCVVLLLTDRLVTHREAAAAMDKSVAVLPFANTSGDPDNEYFSDGLSEQLINTLGRLPDLKVIGRTSSFAFKDKTGDTRRIGDKLGVSYLLEGSVRKAEGRVRIAVELIKASDGSNVWSQSYDRQLGDILAVQGEIATHVANRLQSALLAGGAAMPLAPAAPPGGKVAAYNALLQGDFYHVRHTADALRKAIGFYRQAIAIDPDYGYAWARLGRAQVTLAAKFLASRDARVAMGASARQSAEAALRLAPDSFEAHLSHGYVLETVERNLAGAGAEYRRAAELAPQDPGVVQEVAWLDMELGHLDAAAAGFRRVLARDPLQPSAQDGLGRALLAQGQPAEAEAVLRNVIDQQPQAAITRVWLAMAQMLQGHATPALVSAQREPDPLWRTYALALAQYAGGDVAASDAALHRLTTGHADDAAARIAVAYAQRRQPADMFRWLERAWTSEDAGVVEILYNPFFVPYRQDPRFVAFARKVGVLPADAARLPMPTP